jgi:hypothetical protein
MLRLRMVALIGLIVTGAACGYQTDVTVSRDKVQALLDKKFPIEKDAVLARVKLDSPRVYFQSNQLGMRLRYEAAVLGKQATGEVAFHGAPVYKADEGAFYLSTLTVADFTVDGDGLPHAEKLRDRISSVLDAVIPHVPLYRLRQQDFKHALAKLLLKQVRVEGESLVLTMGL